jgi:hypothetical protein
LEDLIAQHDKVTKGDPADHQQRPRQPFHLCTLHPSVLAAGSRSISMDGTPRWTIFHQAAVAHDQVGYVMQEVAPIMRFCAVRVDTKRPHD